MKFIWRSKTNTEKDEKILVSKVTSDLVASAFERRKDEIESLRKYDRGEKTITPSDLKTVSRGL
jgi:hypothetical protein